MKTLFQNAQWRVTSETLESLDKSYPYEIDARSLGGTSNRAIGHCYNWPLQMAEKGWVDIEAFIEAFATALKLSGAPADPDTLARTSAYAVEMVRNLRKP